MPNLDAEVLLVEDNPTNQLLARRMLEKYGLTVEIVANGQEALDKLGAESFDLVFMDCQMPVMDGFEATRRIRQANGSSIDPDTTIVAMTANAMQGDRQACLDVGMNDYLSKPIDPDELKHMLLKWLSASVM